MGLRALLAKSASAVLPHRHRRASLSSLPPDTSPSVVPPPLVGRRNSLQPRHSAHSDGDSDLGHADEHGATDSDDDSDDDVPQTMAPPSSRTAAPAVNAGATTTRGKAHGSGVSMAARAARLSATAAARITRLVGENPPMGSSARVVRRQYQSIVREREKAFKDDDAERIDAVALYEVEFPKQPTQRQQQPHQSSSAENSPSSAVGENYPLGIDLETDFYGKHTVVKEVKRGSVAYALAKARGTRVLKAGHVVVAVNGHDLTQLPFADVLQELKTASAPRVIRFLDPHVLSVKAYRHEPSLVNRDQYGFAKDDRYILNYRRQLRKRKLAGYDHERRWADFVQLQGGIDNIDRLLHDTSLDPLAQTKRVAVMSELRELVLKGIPAVLRPRVWGLLAGATPYREAYPSDYYTRLVAQIESSVSIGDIEKDIHRTYPEHVFFQSEQGRLELKHVLGAYSLHNPHIGYCQSMNFIAGMMVLLTNEEDAFWLFCALMEKRFLPAENYTQSMVGTQTDQLVFKELVNQELPILAERLEFCGIQIQLVTLHWFLCAFVCTLPTESALRVWDWFCLDGQEVLFITAIGILKQAEPRILGATLYSDLHTIVRELGTDLHDDDAFMEFLYALAPPSDIARREAGKAFDQVWECDEESSGGSSSSGCAEDEELEEEEQEPLEDTEDVEDTYRATKEDPPVAWAPIATAPTKSRRRKRALPAVPVKLHAMLHTFMGSHRKSLTGSKSGTITAAYQKQFTLQDIDTLRSMYRPQFEKTAPAPS